MPQRSVALGSLVLALFACATPSKPRAVWGEGLIVAQNLCTKDHSVQASKDAPGNRAFCELEILVGTHIPKCVCRDEQQIDSERAESQQFMMNEAQAKQNLKGG